MTSSQKKVFLGLSGSAVVIVLLAIVLAMGGLFSESPEAKTSTTSEPQRKRSGTDMINEIFGADEMSPKEKRRRELRSLDLAKAPFTPVTEGLPEGGEWRGKPAIADLNGDGHMDIVASVRKGEGLFMYFNNGLGTKWTAAINGLPRNAGYGGAAVCDADGDGRMDVVFSTHGAPIQVYAGDAKGAWRRHCTGLANEDIASDVAVGDCDGDGDVDIVAVSWAKGGIYYFENLDNKAWKTSVVFPEDQKEFGKSIELEDMDGDGHLDIVATYNGPKVYRGDGKGHFDKELTLCVGLIQPLTGGTVMNTFPADFDADGRPELVSTTMFLEGLEGVYVWKWSATEKTWLPFDEGLPKGETFRGSSAGDFNGDGHNDIVLSSERGVLIYHGDGKGRFKDGQILEGSSKYCVLQVGDFNGDKKQDVLEVYSFRPGGVRVWLQNK